MATIYYIREDGNDINSGTGYTISNAWKTIAKAISVINAGDTIIIAPGTYHETMTLATSGSISTVIVWWGDKEAQYFLDLKPGPVRITNCNSSTGIGTASNTINCNSKNYNYFYNLVVDGSSIGNYVGLYASGAANIKIYDCVISGSYMGVWGNGSSSTIAYRCIFNGGQYGCYGVACHHSTSFGGSYGFYDCEVDNCIGIGVYCIASSTNVNNCLTIGGNTGYYQCVTTLSNCIAYGASQGVYGTSTTILKKFKAINCTTAFVGVTSNLNISDCKYTSCQTVSSGSITGTATLAKYEGYTDNSKLLKLATALKFDIFENDWSTDLHKLTVTNVTSPASANNDYVIVGIYNNENLYQSIFKNYLLFYSATKYPNNWILYASTTTTPIDDETKYDFAFNSSLTGVFSNSGNWSGTTTVSDYTPIVFSENYDFLRNPRRMGSGTTLDCGPFEYSNANLDWTIYKTFAPSIRINQIGNKTLTITVKANVIKTISCWVNFNLDTTADTSPKPQMIINSSEDILTTALTATTTGSGSGWEQLISTFKPKASGFLTVNFQTRYQGDSNAAVTYFSDISL